MAEKIVQMPLSEEYCAKLEADARANDRNACRQASNIVKRYYDGKLIDALPGTEFAPAVRVDPSVCASDGTVAPCARAE